MGYLTREEILQARDLAYEDVEVPEWGGTVRVRGLMAYERDELELEALEAQKKPTAVRNVRARLVARCLVNAEGKRLFTDADAEELGKKHGAVIDRLFWVAQRLSMPQQDEPKNFGTER